MGSRKEKYQVTTVPGLDHHKKIEIGSVGSCNRKPSWLDIRTIGCLKIKVPEAEWF